MTDIALPSTPLGDRMTYAKALAAASLLPPAYRNQPANVLLAMEYGDALGLSPIAAIQGVNVIDGKPSASASLIGALVRRAGHRLRVETTPDGASARATIIRSDDPEFTFTAVWTMERAQAAGLTGKGAWKTYPSAMLKARAITEVARDACPEALSGVQYTAEELGADEHTDRRPSRVEDTRWDHPAADALEQLEDAGIVDISDAEVIDEEPEPVLPENPEPPRTLTGPAGRAQARDKATPSQVKTLTHLMVEQRIKFEVLADYCTSRLGIDPFPGTIEALTKTDASAIITALTEVKA